MLEIKWQPKRSSYSIEDHCSCPGIARYLFIIIVRNACGLPSSNKEMLPLKREMVSQRKRKRERERERARESQSSSWTICQVINDLGIILVFVLIQLAVSDSIWDLYYNNGPKYNKRFCHIDGHKGYCGNCDRKTRVCVRDRDGDHSGSSQMQTTGCPHTLTLRLSPRLSLWLLNGNGWSILIPG